MANFLESVLIIQAVIKGIIYRNKIRARKDFSLKNCLKHKQITRDQFDRRDELFEELNNLKTQNINNFHTKCDIIKKNEYIFSLENTISNINNILKILERIPTICLPPKRRYKNRFNVSLLELLLNIYSNIYDNEYMKMLILLGNTNKILRQNLVNVIKPYINNYLSSAQLSIEKDKMLFRFYIIWCGGCNSYKHKMLDDNCPSMILHNLSLNKTINNDLRQLIYRTLPKKGYTKNLLVKHGIVIC